MSTNTSSQIQRRWRLEPPHRRERRVGLTSRQRRLSLLAAAMLLVVGIAAGMLTWVTPLPTPRFVPLWVNEYRSPLLADNDAAELDRRAITGGGYFSRASAYAVGSLPRYRILQELATLEKLSIDDSAVVYLSAYALCDAKDGVCVLPADYVPGDARSQLSLAKVIEHVKRCPAAGKLLVLDLMWPLAEAGRRGSAADASLAVATELEKLDDPRLCVLCAASPGQKSLVSPELGRSIFGFYFEQALRGYADGCGAAGKRDGRIRARELAAYVCQHVDHWTWHNLRRRQTPTFQGHCDDFDLISLPHGEPLAALAPQPRRGYPAWLKAAWQLRDDWKSAGAIGLAPRLLAQWEHELLAAENAWQLGEDSSRVRGDIQGRSASFTTRWDAACRAVAGPPPRSLAMLRNQGLAADAKFVSDLEDLLAKLAAQTTGLQTTPALAIRQKLMGQFLEQAKGVSPAARAVTIFDCLAREINPRPDLIELLDELLCAAQPQPAYVETEFVRRLARLGKQIPAKEWPAGHVRQALELIRLGEEVNCFQRGLQSCLPIVEQAAGQRRLAELILLRPGYASPATAEQALSGSTALYEQARGRLETLRAAGSQTEEAAALLLALEPLVAEDDSRHSTWLAAANAAAELADQLEASHRHGDLQTLRQGSAAVQSQLTELAGSVSSGAVQGIQQRLLRAEVDPAEIDRAGLLLSTSCLSAGDRAALWQIRHDAAWRMALQYHNRELRDSVSHAPASSLEAYAPQVAEQLTIARAAQRAQRSAALLRLGGVAEKKPTHGETWEALLDGWLARPSTAARQDRLSRIYPAQAPCALLDQTATNPTLKLRRSEALSSWQWLASWYRYLSHEMSDDTFFAEAASEYLNFRGPLSETWVLWDAPRVVPQQDPRAPLTVEVPWRLAGPHATGIQLPLEVLSPPGSPWNVSLANRSARCGEPLQLRVQTAAPSGPSGVPSLGCLLMARLGSREFHLPIALAELNNGREWDVSLSAAQESPTPQLHSLRLRPLPAWQPYFLWVRNRGAAARTIIVQLSPGDTASEKATVAPGQQQQIAFPSAPPKENTELPLLKGPLVARVLDASSGHELARETLHVSVASPREYVAVDSIQFQPAGLKPNRLTLVARALPSLVPPPCLVELLLPPRRIEGYSGAKSGVFRGVLAQASQTLPLSAEGLALAENTGDSGCIYINVDDCPRAFVFRAALARQGDATTPFQDPRPALRLEAPLLALAGPNISAELEVDEGPAGSTLLVELGSLRQGVFHSERSAEFPTPRQQRIGFAPSGPGGAMIFSAAVRDWQADFDATGIVGRRLLRARLTAADGQTICAAEQALTLDDSPPTRLKLLDVPRRTAKGVPLVLTAHGQDDFSGIASATFFLGSPREGKLPQGAITAVGRPANAEAGSWTASLDLPPEAKAQITVGVQFTNGVGLSSLATAKLEVVDAAVLALGKIVGIVREGPRPQAGLEVVLKNDKAAEIAKTKTDEHGDFTFDSIAPGSYTITTSKPASLRKAAASVTVEKSQAVSVTLRLEI